MNGTIRLGRVFGIEIRLHYSWVLIAMLIAVSLSNEFRGTHLEWPMETVWASAILTAILFFMTLVAHELAHSLVARMFRVPVRNITLFALGGVAQLEGESPNATAELLIAIAGPSASLGIGGFCLVLANLLGWPWMAVPESPTLAVLVWLGFINFTLAAFNMIPGFPLDGGRVLHAIAWRWTGDPRRSLRIASRTGRVVAGAFILIGMLRFLIGAGFGALWLAILGWFLFEAAGTTYSQARVAEALRGLLVRDLMSRDCPTVELHENLLAFVEQQLMHTGGQCYVVMENGRPDGLIGPLDAKAVPRPQWPYHTVADAMRPLDQMPALAPDTPIVEALEAMGREDAAQLPVASEGRLEGVLSRAAVFAFLETRAELRA